MEELMTLVAIFEDRLEIRPHGDGLPILRLPLELENGMVGQFTVRFQGGYPDQKGPIIGIHHQVFASETVKEMSLQLEVWGKH